MIQKILFGSTGHKSSRVIFGGAAFWEMTQEKADETLPVLLKYGINHIDTAMDYNESEDHVGPWMDQHRKDFFLATKTSSRTAVEARKNLENSLKRLHTDHVDLLQMHCLVDEQEWKTVFSPGGALEAFVQARDEGLVRFLGITGHGINVPQMHLRSLKYFDFDSVLLPLNYPMMQDPVYAEPFLELREFCRRKNVAFQTIKSLSKGIWGEKQQTCNTWYEPLTDENDIRTAVHYVLGHEGVFLNSTADVGLLPRILKAASEFSGPVSDQEMKDLSSRTGMVPLFTQE